VSAHLPNPSLLQTIPHYTLPYPYHHHIPRTALHYIHYSTPHHTSHYPIYHAPQLLSVFRYAQQNATLHTPPHTTHHSLLTQAISTQCHCLCRLNSRTSLTPLALTSPLRVRRSTHTHTLIHALVCMYLHTYTYTYTRACVCFVLVHTHVPITHTLHTHIYILTHIHTVAGEPNNAALAQYISFWIPKYVVVVSVSECA
jgi:hypothetical protein